MSKVTELARTSSVAKGDDEGGGERGSQTIRCPVRIGHRIVWRPHLSYRR
jgi:hypothetical protein